MASKSNIVNINEFVKRNPKLNSLISTKPASSATVTPALNKESKTTATTKDSYLKSHKEYLENLSKKRNRSSSNYEK